MSRFVFTAQAGPATGDRPGDRHALLVFAEAPDREVAASPAVERVAAEGWLTVLLLRGKAAGDDPATIPDPTIRRAAEDALAEGCAFVVYADPIPHDA